MRQDKERKGKVQPQALSSRGGCDLVCRRSPQDRSCITLGSQAGKKGAALGLGLGCRRRVGKEILRKCLLSATCRQKAEGAKDGVQGWTEHCHCQPHEAKMRGLEPQGRTSSMTIPPITLASHKQVQGP